MFVTPSSHVCTCFRQKSPQTEEIRTSVPVGIENEDRHTRAFAIRHSVADRVQRSMGRRHGAGHLCGSWPQGSHQQQQQSTVRDQNASLLPLRSRLRRVLESENRRRPLPAVQVHRMEMNGNHGTITM